MKRIFYIVLLAWAIPTALDGENLLNKKMASKLAEMPLHCISQEYPNKTGHTFRDSTELNLSPKDLHPVFFGCFDWHSSVHGHWLLVRLLREFPNIEKKSEIIKVLNNSFKRNKIQKEATYFSKYKLGNIFERTYGWAWILKLDEELSRSTLPQAKIWHENLQPLTDTIVNLWLKYLPKQTYPNRTGVHPNTAFAIGFAIDWARRTGNTEFEEKLVAKAISFYGKDEKTPAYLEPNGSDFFSPSLEIADLMSRVYTPLEFSAWFEKFFDKRGLDNVCKLPIVSDIEDYKTVHLVGLSFSKAWCMKRISLKLEKKNPTRKMLKEASTHLIKNGLPLLFEGNYGGGHWLASFALYSLASEE